MICSGCNQKCLEWSRRYSIKYGNRIPIPRASQHRSPEPDTLIERIICTPCLQLESSDE